MPVLEVDWMRVHLRHHALRLVGLVLVALLLPRAGGSDEETPGSWIPLTPGTEWTYVYMRERTRQAGPGGAARERFRGTMHDVVKGPAPTYGTSAVEIVSRVTGRNDGETIESTEIRRAFVESVGTGYRVHALDVPDPLLGGSRLTRYDPPLEQLMTGPGREKDWMIGNVDLGGLRSRLDAKVVGIQDVKTPSGSYEGCLVVRYEGKLAGKIELAGMTAEVTEGRVVATEWFARGVGIVLAKEEVEQTFLLPGGIKTRVSERIQYSLSARTTPNTAPASR